MRLKIILFLALNLLGITLIFGASTELLKNNLFAQNDSAGKPKSWILRGNGSLIKIISQGVHITADAQGKPTYLLQTLPLKGGCRYRVTWTDHADGVNKYQLYVEWTVSSGKATLSKGAHTDEISAETITKPRSFEFDYSNDSNPGYFALTVRHGSVNIRDISIQEVISPTPFVSNFAHPGKNWMFTRGSAIKNTDIFSGPALILNGKDAKAAYSGIELQPGKTYCLSYLVKATGRGNAIGTQSVRLSLESLPFSWTDTWSDNVQYKSVEFTAPAKSTPVTLVCEIKDGGVAIDKIKISETKFKLMPLTLLLNEPVYRNDIFTSMPVKQIAGQINCRLKNCSWRIELLGSDGKVLNSAELTGLKNTFSFPATGLAVGNYTLRVIARSAAGKVLAEHETGIRVLSHRDYETVIGQDQQIYVNGKLFFPVLTWTLLKKWEKSAWIKPMLYHCARHGINSLTVFMDDPKLPEILATAKQYNMKVVIEMNFPGPGNKAAMERWKRNYDQVMTSELIKQQALLGYLSVDEPCWGGKDLEPIQQLYQQHKAFDPYHPVWLNEAPRNEIFDIKPYSNACDIYGCDIYPVPDGNGHSALPNQFISSVGDYTRRMCTVIDNRKPVWMALQAFAWGSLFGNKREFPTLEQMRFMTYDTYLSGGKAATFWGVDSIDKPEFWDTFFRLTEELHRISGVLVASEANDKIRCNNTEIVFSVRQTGNNWYILAVNRSTRSINADFEVIGGKEGQFSELHGNPVENTTKGFRDTIEGFGSRLYVAGTLPSPVWQLPPVDPAMEKEPFPGKIRAEKGNMRYSGEKYHGDAAWIYGPRLLNGEASVCTLSRNLQLDADPEKALLYVTSDDFLHMKINGQNVSLQYQGWCYGNIIDIQKWLHSGNNLIEAEVKNSGGPGGLLFDLNVTTRNNKNISLKSDASWQSAVAGKKIGKAEVIAPYGSGAWGKGVFFFKCKQ